MSNQMRGAAKPMRKPFGKAADTGKPVYPPNSSQSNQSLQKDTEAGDRRRLHSSSLIPGDVDSRESLGPRQVLSRSLKWVESEKLVIKVEDKDESIAAKCIETFSDPMTRAACAMLVTAAVVLLVLILQ